MDLRRYSKNVLERISLSNQNWMVFLSIESSSSAVGWLILSSGSLFTFALCSMRRTLSAESEMLRMTESGGLHCKHSVPP